MDHQCCPLKCTSMPIFLSTFQPTERLHAELCTMSTPGKQQQAQSSLSWQSKDKQKCFWAFWSASVHGSKLCSWHCIMQSVSTNAPKLLFLVFTQTERSLHLLHPNSQGSHQVLRHAKIPIPDLLSIKLQSHSLESSCDVGLQVDDQNSLLIFIQKDNLNATLTSWRLQFGKFHHGNCFHFLVLTQCAHVDNRKTKQMDDKGGPIRELPILCGFCHVSLQGCEVLMQTLQGLQNGVW